MEAADTTGNISSAFEDTTNFIPFPANLLSSSFSYFAVSPTVSTYT